MFAGFRVPAVDETANAELRARDAGDQHVVGDQRRDRHGITFLPLGRLLVPDLLAGLHVERDDMRVERGAVELAVENRGALVGNTATHDARRLRHPVDRRFPDLLAGADVDRHRRLGVGDIHHPVEHQRLRLLAPWIVEAEVPDRHQAFDRRLVDLFERAIAVKAIAHAIGQHVVGVLAVVLEIVERLRRCRAREHNHHDRSRYRLHDNPPVMTGRAAFGRRHVFVPEVSASPTPVEPDVRLDFSYRHAPDAECGRSSLMGSREGNVKERSITARRGDGVQPDVTEHMRHQTWLTEKFSQTQSSRMLRPPV